MTTPRRTPVRALGIAGFVLALIVTAITTSPASGEVVGGRAVISTPDRTSPLRSGGSGTTYGLSLPDDARCPGDTEHRAYHLFSYLVPQGHQATDVSFKTGIPSRWFGYIADGAYFGAVNTQPDTGRFQTIPDDFTWVRLTPKDLFPAGKSQATWEGGLACADGHGRVTNYWNTEIVFTADSHDALGFTWHVPDDTLGSTGTQAWVVVALAIGALATLALVVLLVQRRRITREADRVDA